MKVLDFKTIKDMNISTADMYQWCNDAWALKNQCVLPAKVKMWVGESGRYTTMPCVIPSLDIAGVKFISRNVDDVNGIPARNSHIMIQKCSELGIVALLDGMWITNMRTAAIAAHSVFRYAKSDANTLGLMGLGLVSWAFMKFIGDLSDKKYTIKLLRYKNQAEQFIERFKHDYPQFEYVIVDSYDEICSCDIVVSAVSYARNEFASDAVYKPGCLVVPIQTSGFQNCDLSFDKVIIDDLEHVKSYKYFDKFKDKISEVSLIENGTISGRDSDEQRIVAYCGGIALHDIYCAFMTYKKSCELNVGANIDMRYPEKHLWI